MQGEFYSKKKWDGKPLPRWEEAKELLPEPVLDDRPEALDAYWTAWEGCIKSMRSPTPENGFVSNYLYMEFSRCIFAHDTAVMALFARYGLRAFDAAESFDNFYAKQHETGEICREISCDTGKDYWARTPADPVMVHLSLSDRTLGYQWNRPTAETHPPGHVEIDGLNDACALLWGELACYSVSADKARLARILEPQRKWFDAFNTYVRDTNGLYITDWASADNHPRNDRLGYGVDVAGAMALFARLLSKVCGTCGVDGATEYDRSARDISRCIRKLMWDRRRRFFLDVDRNGSKIDILSVLGFWPLHARVATRGQARALVAHLRDPGEFDTAVPVPNLAKSEPAYSPLGSYFFGGSFSFTNAMVIEGLEKYGYVEDAARIANRFWDASVRVFRETGTHWEYLQPEVAAPGRTVGEDGWNARSDFTGWGAWAPISLLIEYAIGLRVDAPNRTVTWNLGSTSRCGCRRFAFGDVNADIVVDRRSDPEERPRLTSSTNVPFDLVLRWGRGREERLRIKP